MNAERLAKMAAGREAAKQERADEAYVIVDDYRQFVRREAELHAAMRRRREDGIDAEYLAMQQEHRELWRTVTIPTDAQFGVAELAR